MRNLHFSWNRISQPSIWAASSSNGTLDLHAALFFHCVNMVWRIFQWGLTKLSWNVLQPILAQALLNQKCLKQTPRGSAMAWNTFQGFQLEFLLESSWNSSWNPIGIPAGVHIKTKTPWNVLQAILAQAQLESSWDSSWNPAGILAGIHAKIMLPWKMLQAIFGSSPAGIPARIPAGIHLEFQLESSRDSSWKLTGIPIWIQLEFQLESNWNTRSPC